MVDVRRGEIATASYRPLPGGVVKDGPAVLTSVEEFRATILGSSDDVLVVGDVDALGEGFFNGLHRARTGRPRHPDAGALLELSANRFANDDVPHPDEVRPRYLREPDVTISSVHLRGHGPWGDLS